jgi:uncharacterized protein
VLIVDTGVLLAAVDNADPDHAACAELVNSALEPLVTTALVIAETAYLIGRQLGPRAEAAFFRSIANGDIVVDPLSSVDDLRIADLVEQYADMPLGGTDGASSLSPRVAAFA